ncbi:hypothetical protein OUZ56_017602 [Daphnia magna]|uniref:Uncharacterized protein n=1 Tax=Daphnia magna TaxID=35525 RepID=A0ABR0AT80_9CRUS|nr:hypothetical protein OUZ56_017602 [Daphnia magna]
MVDPTTGLCGLTEPMNKFFSFAELRRSSVSCIYRSAAATGSTWWSDNLLIENDLSAPLFCVFLGLKREKFIPTPSITKSSLEIAASSDTRRKAANASKVASLRASAPISSSSFLSCPRCLTILFTSHGIVTPSTAPTAPSQPGGLVRISVGPPCAGQQKLAHLLRNALATVTSPDNFQAISWNVLDSHRGWGSPRLDVNRSDCVRRSIGVSHARSNSIGNQDWLGQ